MGSCHEFHSHQALLARQFVENEPFLARNAFICYTLYSSIPKDRIVEEFELPYPRVISTSTFLYYRVAVVDLKGKAGVQRTQSFAGVWGGPSFFTQNPPKGCRAVCTSRHGTSNLRLRGKRMGTTLQDSTRMLSRLSSSQAWRLIH